MLKEFKKWIFIIIILFMVTGINIGCNKKNENQSEYRTEIIQKSDISSSVLATGIIKPGMGAEVRVGSRVSGIVQKLYANIGDQVKKGQLLAELDPTELQAKYNQTKAAFMSTKINYEYSKDELKNQKVLSDRNFISESEFNLSTKTVKINKTLLNQAEANLEYADIQLKNANIYAPIAGVIASVSTQEGETVAASFSAPTFVTIIDLDRLEVWAYIDETDIGRIHEGQKAIFSVDTYNDTDFEGQVTAIYPKADIQDNVVTYITIIKINDYKNKSLRPEMTATINIYQEINENVFTVSNEAIRNENSRKYVYILKNNKPEKRWVETGMKNRNQTEIIEGVQNGEIVILNNIDRKRL